MDYVMEQALKKSSYNNVACALRKLNHFTELNHFDLLVYMCPQFYFEGWLYAVIMAALTGVTARGCCRSGDVTFKRSPCILT